MKFSNFGELWENHKKIANFQNFGQIWYIWKFGKFDEICKIWWNLPNFENFTKVGANLDKLVKFMIRGNSTFL